MKTKSGEEFSCKAHEFNFDHGGIKKRRGIISYYATQTLAQADSMQAWLVLIEKTGQKDLEAGVITEFHRPELMILGDDQSILLPGVLVK